MSVVVFSASIVKWLLQAAPPVVQGSLSDIQAGFSVGLGPELAVALVRNRFPRELIDKPQDLLVE